MSFINKSVHKYAVLMTISTGILAIVIPFIDSYQRKIEINVLESAIHMSESNRFDSSCADNLNFSNWILATGNLKDKNIDKVYQLYRNQAVRHRRYALAMRYLAINDKYPNKIISDRWNSMDIDKLEDEEIKNSDFFKFDWRKKARSSIFWLRIVKYIFYAAALILYTKGLIGLNLLSKQLKSK
ncbi:MAG: hypothetical protein WC947_08280 [Elusimicrobiota bacterium]